MGKKYELDIPDINSEELTPNEEVYKKKSDKKTAKKRRKKIWRIFLIVFITLSSILLFLFGTRPGRSVLIHWASVYLSDKFNSEEDIFDFADTDDGVGDDASVDLNYSSSDENLKSEEYVSNYLIIGIEKIFDARNTDVIMIASINTYDNTIKLTSILRDTLVDLPGYSQNKINAAYAKGGADYLIEVIEKNFKIQIDGYASVDFDSFEDIVDSLGGVEIELSQKEADYLNTTNYISDPANRNVVAGLQVLNGNQVVGYCRVRKVPTLDGTNYDYGRTQRQRRVLEAIFEKYKSSNIIDMISIMNKCMTYVTTDVTTNQIKTELTNIVENKIMTLETLRIPENGAFTEADKIGNVTSALVPDLDVTIQTLHDFIYTKDE